MDVPTPPRNTRARVWGIRIAGTLLFAGLLLWLDLSGALPLERLGGVLSQADVSLTAFSIALYVPFLIVKALRWRALAADMRMPLSWAESWRAYAIGLAAGTFTPGQAGDTLKAWYLQRAGYPLGRAFGSSVLDRLFDVVGLAPLGLLGVAVYGGRFAGQAPVLAAWAALGLLILAIITLRPLRIWLLGQFAKRRKKVQGADGFADDAGWSLRPATIAGALLLTVASFGLSIFRVWLLAAAVGVVLGPAEVAGFVGLTTAAALVPVSVGGVGTRDVVAALAFTQLGRAPEEGIAVSLLILLLNAAQAVAGWAVWLTFRSVPWQPQGEPHQKAR